MRVFVACWFFPPSVSSEGIVAYKLLRNSRNDYDVCSSLSQQWSYQQTMPLEADNITVLPVDTDDLDEWVDECIRIFEERHAREPYDAIMTRSMPPESIEVGKRVHEAHPELPWIASLADPIAKSPYDIKAWIVEAQDLSEQDKVDLLGALHYQVGGWRNSTKPEVVKLCALKDAEDYAIDHATALIFPHESTRSYILGSRRRRHAFVVHHSFDPQLFPKAENTAGDGRVVLTFTGHTDRVRSLEPLVRALHRTRTIDASALEKLDVRFIGHVDEDVRALIFNYDLHNCISITPNAAYAQTLDAMLGSDWLIHVDANFDFLEAEGGSVYFAGKIADYLGTEKPILAMTGKHSPAYGIITRAGGLCFEQNDIAGLAEALVDIANARLEAGVDRSYRDRFSAASVAAEYDSWLEALVEKEQKPFERSSWPEIPQLGACARKFLSICIPAYNVSCYLDRCLFSIASSPVADQIEVIVVDDGSPDDSAAIALAYQEHYPTVFKVIRKENGGHGSTINAALAVASGIYFRVIDGDDWIDGWNLGKLIENLRNLDDLPDLVSANYHQVNTESGQMIPWVKRSGELNFYESYDFATTDMTSEYFTMASMMAKTELLRIPDFKLDEHTYYVDVEYLIFAIPYIETVAFTPEYVYRYAVGNAEQSVDPIVFASRYEHHDRVIRRMIAYYKQHAATMGQGQREYLKSLFSKYLIDTHYLLNLKWEPDKSLGYNRAREFDRFLQETAPDLHAAFEQAHPSIRLVRSSDFDTSVEYDSEDSGGHAIGSFLRKASYVIEKNPIGSRIVHNETLRSMARRFL